MLDVVEHFFELLYSLFDNVADSNMIVSIFLHVGLHFYYIIHCTGS